MRNNLPEPKYIFAHKLKKNNKYVTLKLEENHMFPQKTEIDEGEKEHKSGMEKGFAPCVVQQDWGFDV